MKQEIIERFIRYVRVDTQSDDNSQTVPSTPGQLELGRLLAEELAAIGLSDVTMDANGYVMATLPANTDKNVPVIGFLAHLDTSPAMTGRNVNPQIHHDYDGKPIVLNERLGVVLSPEQFPELSSYKGHTLITTDGTTLLGADDKAGIAEIMTAMAYLRSHPEILHGTIRVAFTPDEEIGRGPAHFDVQAFGAAYAYTVDGGPLGGLEYESFNAAIAKLTFQGTSTHPGTAKGKMVNACKLAMEFHGQLPELESPEYTEGYEGFYHLVAMGGDVERAASEYIIRDFDHDNFEARKRTFKAIAERMRQKYGDNRINLEMRDQYYNMLAKIEPVREIVDIACEAMENVGIKPHIQPIRGGTDGSQLSYMGLPTPNLFTGGENYHGKFEYISADNMVKAVRVIVEIARLFEEKAT